MTINEMSIICKILYHLQFTFCLLPTLTSYIPWHYRYQQSCSPNSMPPIFPKKKEDISGLYSSAPSIHSILSARHFRELRRCWSGVHPLLSRRWFRWIVCRWHQMMVLWISCTRNSRKCPGDLLRCLGYSWWIVLASQTWRIIIILIMSVVSIFDASTSTNNKITHNKVAPPVLFIVVSLHVVGVGGRTRSMWWGRWKNEVDAV